MAIIKEFFKWLFYMKSFIFYISMFGFQKIFHRRSVSRILILISIYNRNMKNMIFFFNFWQEQVLIPFIFSIFHTHFYLIMQMYRMILVTENDQIKINDFWNDRCKIKKKRKEKLKISVQMNTSILTMPLCILYLQITAFIRQNHGNTRWKREIRDAH